jgi:hypothetical protein
MEKKTFYEILSWNYVRNAWKIFYENKTFVENLDGNQCTMVSENCMKRVIFSFISKKKNLLNKLKKIVIEFRGEKYCTVTGEDYK